jgi:hypothetical protein
MKTKSKSKLAGLWPIVAGLIACIAPFAFAAHAHGQAPNLVVTAGPTGQAPALTVTSDSANSWKCFTVSGSGGQYNVVWAESTGTSGGIYFGTIVASTSGGAGPVTPPAPVETLPIGALTASVSAAVAGVDGPTVSALASGFETLANQVDAGAITNPTQLYLSLGVEALALTAPQRTAVTPLTTAVKAWLNAQQTAGKLSEEKMPDYARVFHAIAKALKPGTVTPAAAAIPKETPANPVGASPCASGHCPKAEPYQYRRGRR